MELQGSEVVKYFTDCIEKNSVSASGSVINAAVCAFPHYELYTHFFILLLVLLA
mgnify:CR=1 FL=1